MKTTNKTLKDQLRLSNREIERRKEYFSINQVDCNLLKEMKEIVRDSLDDIIGEFYKKLLVHGEIDRIIGDSETLVRLKNHFKAYLLSLFEGEIDEEYVHSRLRVGVVHCRIGVEPKYYVSAVHQLGSILRKTIMGQSSSTKRCLAGCEAVEKILLFDLSLTFDTYIHSLMDESRRSREELVEYTESLEETISERTKLLKEQARHDGLTGLLNQRTFFNELRKELSRGKRQGYPVVLVYFDVDGFKAINDSEGHRAGDTILVNIAKAVKNTIRQGEIVARYGGDEFCVILPDSTEEEATILSKRICEEIHDLLDRRELSCSMGIAVSDPDNSFDAEKLVQLADKAMYEAKKDKGNSIKTAVIDG